MVKVSYIFDEVKKIVGNSDQAFVFKRITDAVRLLAIKGEWNPLLGYLDICATSRYVTLPSEIETPLAVNMCGCPTVARDQLFNFHLNGPGDRDCNLDWSWTNMGEFYTYREIECPNRLIALGDASDVNKKFRAYGFDQNNNRIRTDNNGTLEDGWDVPILTTYAMIDPDAPHFSRITRVTKDQTNQAVRLSTLDVSNATGTLLGYYQWNETEPQFRRIRLSRDVEWVRMAYRKRTFEISSLNDLIPLANAQAVIMMVRALKTYDEPGGTPEAELMEATAVRWLTEEQFMSDPPVVHPIQVEGPTIMDHCDYVD